MPVPARLYDEAYIPGTIDNIFADRIDEEHSEGKSHLKTKNGIILFPQPSDSPNDPLNWSPLTKYWQLAVLAFITGFTAATSNDAGAAQDSLNEIYGITYDAMNTGAGVLFIGIGYSCLVLAPSSFLYGRKINYMICILLGLIGAAWFGAAKRTSDTIWSQLFVGISESCAEAQVQLSLSDLFYSYQLGHVLTVYILATSVGTYLGPLIAGFIVDRTTFRWVGWCAVIISGGLLIVMLFTLYETSFDREKYIGKIDAINVYSNDSTNSSNHEDSKLKDDKERTNNKENDAVISTNEFSGENEVHHRNGFTRDSDDELAAAPTGVSAHPIFSPQMVEGTGADEEEKSYWKKIQLITLADNIKGTGFKQYIKRLFGMLRVFWFPPVILSGLVWGAQDAFLTFYLTTEDDDYYDPPWNYSDIGVSLMNVPCVIGAVIGCLYAGIFSDYFVLWMAKRNGGKQEAEYRLWFLFAAAIFSPAGMLMFGIGTDKEAPWQLMYVGLGFIGFGWGCSGDIAMSYLMDAYPDMVLEGMVGVAVINNTIGCAFTFGCSPWLDAMGNQNTYIILAVIDFVVCMGALPMIIWGKRCRIWTKQSYIKFLELRDNF
ncbi:hypothetical protein B5S29_g472 [[Candida] boidinii]|nr:hypothetical protein B5S29_g472 [[Candida] boidinii]